ncbi:MAG: hypothetical protein R2765_03420 [Ferruginibacter sp.]
MPKAISVLTQVYNIGRPLRLGWDVDMRKMWKGLYWVKLVTATVTV